MELMPAAVLPKPELSAADIVGIFTTDLFKAVRFYARQVWLTGCNRAARRLMPITITCGSVALQLTAIESSATKVCLSTPSLGAAHIALAESGAVVESWPGVLRLFAHDALVIEIVEAQANWHGFVIDARVPRGALAEAIAPLA